MKKPAIFLDRDGTICREVNYLSHPDNLEIFPFAGRAIRIFNESGFPVIVVTNQSGIARGFFDEGALSDIHRKLIDRLGREGARIDGIYFCPHGPGDRCACRKPEIGLLCRAERDFDLDLSASWMIGDKASDIETGFNADLKTALVLTGYGREELAKLHKNPDLTGENLLVVAERIRKLAERRAANS